jgi:glucokinase
MADRQIRVGIDIGGTKMLLLAQGDNFRSRVQLTTGIEFSGVDAETAITEFIQTLPTAPISLGIAIPGLVSAIGTVIACDVLPQIVEWTPARQLQSIYPVSTLNDAEAALVQVISDLQPKTIAVVVMVGTGIGAAISIDGQILRGAKGWAGELGSIPIGMDGSTLDRVASGTAILQQLDLDLDRLIALVAANDPIALHAIERAGTALGLGLATLINLFNPEQIVLAGGTFRWQGYLAAAVQSAQRHSLPDLWAACQLQTSQHEGDLVGLGAMRFTGDNAERMGDRDSKISMR